MHLVQWRLWIILAIFSNSLSILMGRISYCPIGWILWTVGMWLICLSFQVRSQSKCDLCSTSFAFVKMQELDMYRYFIFWRYVTYFEQCRNCGKRQNYERGRKLNFR